jgi:poly(3-hydroxybutyrate) depolymerase
MKLDWTRCSSERGVTLYRVEGGGHQVFGSTNFLPLLLGSGTRRVSAPDVIMAAFSKGEL